jgi:undecaprenyl-diphosphatase
LGVEHHAWVTFWNALCTVFSPAVFRLVTLALIGYELVRRRVRIALFLALSVELSAALIVLAKFLADRPRPASAMVSASSTSFPSGHALGAMVAVLALTVVYAPRRAGAMRSAVLIAGALVVVLVGVGRVALNVHHLSDVVAGWALGYLYLAVCLPVLREPRVRAAVERPEALDTGR